MIRTATGSSVNPTRILALTGVLLAAMLLLPAGVALPGVTDARAAAAGPAPETTLPEIEDEVMCPICGTLLSLSASPAAQRERAFIRRLIARGQSKEEIKRALVAEYGGQVLAEPERRGINLWAYVLPTLLIVLAALAVILSIVRLRRRRPGEQDIGSDPDDVPGSGEGGNPPADDERLNRDMARFDL